jgi:putative ABC transport system permease protein
MQALILGALGSLLGLAGGLVFARGAIKAVGRTVQALYVDQPAADIVFGADTLALAFAAGLLLTAVAALGPIWEAMSVPPAEAARRASYELRISAGSPRLAVIGCMLMGLAWCASLAPAINGFPLFGYLAAALTIFGVALCMPIILARIVRWGRPLMQKFFGSEGKLAIVSLGGTLGRTSVTVASLMVGIAMMVSLAIMIGSFRETVIVWVKQTLKADLYVEPASRAVSNRVGRLSNEVVENIRHLPGVEDVDSFIEFSIIYNDAPANLAAGDLDVLARHGRLMFVDNEDPQAVFSRLLEGDRRIAASRGKTAKLARGPDPGCVVSESFALRNNLKKGDSIVVSTPAGDMHLKIEGVYYDYSSDSGFIILTRSLFRRYFPDTYSTTLGVYLQPDADIEKVRSQMVTQLGRTTRLNVRTNRELRNEVLRVFDNTFAITYALHAISILVAILGVMNALFALTFEMRRDFAILRYIGASLGQLRKMILLQAATLGLLGTTAGMLVGFVLSLLLINVINKQSFGWTIQLSVPFQFLIQSFALVMLFSLLSGILPARSATKNISPEAVRIE